MKILRYLRIGLVRLRARGGGGRRHNPDRAAADDNFNAVRWGEIAAAMDGADYGRSRGVKLLMLNNIDYSLSELNGGWIKAFAPRATGGNQLVVPERDSSNRLINIVLLLANRIRVISNAIYLV